MRVPFPNKVAEYDRYLRRIVFLQYFAYAVERIAYHSRLGMFGELEVIQGGTYANITLLLVYNFIFFPIGGHNCRNVLGRVVVDSLSVEGSVEKLALVNLPVLEYHPPVAL